MARLSTEFISGGVRIRKRYPEGERTKPQPGDVFRDRGNPSHTTFSNRLCAHLSLIIKDTHLSRDWSLGCQSPTHIWSMMCISTKRLPGLDNQETGSEVITFPLLTTAHPPAFLQRRRAPRCGRSGRGRRRLCAPCRRCLGSRGRWGVGAAAGTAAAG